MSEKIYKIGEAAQLLNLKSYVLRFWETEFPQLKPTRTESGQRLYSSRDLELLKRIRHLLHERGLTIEGARKILSDVQFATDDGLSRELLDEGYKDFIADLDVAGFEDDPLPASAALAGAPDLPGLADLAGLSGHSAQSAKPVQSAQSTQSGQLGQPDLAERAEHAGPGQLNNAARDYGPLFSTTESAGNTISAGAARTCRPAETGGTDDSAAARQQAAFAAEAAAAERELRDELRNREFRNRELQERALKSEAMLEDVLRELKELRTLFNQPSQS